MTLFSKIWKYKNFISFYTLEIIQTFSIILFDELIKKNNVTDRLIGKKSKKKNEWPKVRRYKNVTISSLQKH